MVLRRLSEGTQSPVFPVFAKEQCVGDLEQVGAEVVFGCGFQDVAGVVGE